VLAPAERALYTTCLQAPPGFQFDAAVATTYSLDLETVLILPFTFASQREVDPESLLKDPVSLIEGVREAAGRIVVFYDGLRLHVPPKGQRLFALLEDCVVPVRPPTDGAAFHPKLWLMRFVPTDEEHEAPLLRAVVLSRNMTFDRCWDSVLCLEGTPGKRSVPESTALSELVGRLGSLTTLPLDPARAALTKGLADEARNTRFAAPVPFVGTAKFHAIGLNSKPWRPQVSGRRLMAISPFLRKTAMDSASTLASREWIAISREEEFNQLSESAREDWDCYVLRDAVETGDVADAGGDTDESDDRPEEASPMGLHAKLLVVEDARSATWWVGSANLSHAAWAGRNVELAVELTGPRRKVGIDTFLDSGFMALLEPFEPSEPNAEELARQEALNRANELRAELHSANLHLEASATDGKWSLRLGGKVQVPEEVEVSGWPLSVSEGTHAHSLKPLTQGSWVTWPGLDATSLSRFLGIALKVRHEGVTVSVRFALKLKQVGFPADRAARILRDVVQNHDGFFRYLRLLLANDKANLGLPPESNGDGGKATRGTGRHPLKDVVLEDLIRMLSREPERLDGIARLISDLCETEEGAAMIPPDFLTLWETILSARSDA
jgi:hypothetical protein